MNPIADASTSDAGAGPDWHLPGAALARFQAPARNLMQVGSLHSQEFARYGFRIGGIGLLIAQGADAELVQTSTIAPIPLSAASLLGMMNRHGHPVPVFDLRAALDLPAEDAAASAAVLVLVLGKGDDALGLRVQEHPIPLRGLAATTAAPPLPARLAAHSTAAWIAQGEPWVEFNHRGFFGAPPTGFEPTANRQGDL
jgi:CheW-like domain